MTLKKTTFLLANQNQVFTRSPAISFFHVNQTPKLVLFPKLCLFVSFLGCSASWQLSFNRLLESPAEPRICLAVCPLDHSIARDAFIFWSVSHNVYLYCAYWTEWNCFMSAVCSFECHRARFRVWVFIAELLMNQHLFKKKTCREINQQTRDRMKYKSAFMRWVYATRWC